MARRRNGAALNERQEKFCLEYLKDLNGTQAAIRAGYSERTAQEQSSRLLSKAIVTARVDALNKARNQRLNLKADDVLRELLRIAQVDISRIYDLEGRLLPVHDMPEDVRRAISGVETVEVGDDDKGIASIRKVRFWDKTKALELLAKHLKLLTDRVEVVEGGMAEGLKKARLRAQKR